MLPVIKTKILYYKSQRKSHYKSNTSHEEKKYDLNELVTSWGA